MAARRQIASNPLAHAYAVILAGGSGTRFWPLSRQARPKQLLSLFGKGTLLGQTVGRIRPLVPVSRIFVFTHEAMRRQVERLLPEIPRRQIIGEPARCNTAPTIGLAAHEVLSRDSDGMMIILPSDQRVEKASAFREALAAACRWAATEGRSVVIGIKPDRPDTGYGYVRLGRRAARLAGQNVFEVEEFTEKPTRAVAKRYLASGHFLWNAGIFVWRASTLLDNLARFEPQMAKVLEGISRAGGAANSKAMRSHFPRLKRISIDYALMERIGGVFAVPAEIGWSDLGSWEVAYRLQKKDGQGNVAPRNSIAIDARGNLILSDRKLVAAVGVRDMVIIETEDALLVCARDRSQDVGRVVEEAARRGLREIL